MDVTNLSIWLENITAFSRVLVRYYMSVLLWEQESFNLRIYIYNQIFNDLFVQNPLKTAAVQKLNYTCSFKRLFTWLTSFFINLDVCFDEYSLPLWIKTEQKNST